MTHFAFLLDVDNTLIDNDRAKVDLGAGIERLIGAAGREAFWAIYEAARREVDRVDYPLTLARFRATWPAEPRYPELAALVLGFPYEDYVYPGAFAAIAHLRALGAVAILSDGDPVYQAAKVGRAGLSRSVDAGVIISEHKQAILDAVVGQVPADRHVFVDDKPDVLAAIKRELGGRCVTVFVVQGKYAHAGPAPDPKPDLRLATVADLMRLTPADLIGKPG